MLQCTNTSAARARGRTRSSGTQINNPLLARSRGRRVARLSACQIRLGKVHRAGSPGSRAPIHISLYRQMLLCEAYCSSALSAAPCWPRMRTHGTRAGGAGAHDPPAVLRSIPAAAQVDQSPVGRRTRYTSLSSVRPRAAGEWLNAVVQAPFAFHVACLPPRQPEQGVQPCRDAPFALWVCR